jgi:uncharacterized protein (TIGR02246 family)
VHRLRFAFGITLLALTAPAAAQNAPANMPPAKAALWQQIRAVNDSMEAAFNRGDMLAVSHYYADDAKLAGQGGPVVEGRAAIDKYWTGIANPKSWKLEVLSVGGGSQLAYQTGRSHLTTKGADGADHVSRVDFVVVWRRQAGGAWRIQMDLY